MLSKVLMVCHSEKQLREAQLAFGRDAYHYGLMYGAMTGHRFDRIIVLGIKYESAVEVAEYERMIREILPTKLTPKGELYIL